MADDLAGKARHLGGKIQEKVGELLGDSGMETEGALNQEQGRAEQDAERAKEQLRAARTREQLAKEAKELDDYQP